MASFDYYEYRSTVEMLLLYFSGWKGVFKEQFGEVFGYVMHFIHCLVKTIKSTEASQTKSEISIIFFFNVDDFDPIHPSIETLQLCAATPRQEIWTRDPTPYQPHCCMYWSTDCSDKRLCLSHELGASSC